MSTPPRVAPQTSFTDQLWVSIEPIYAAILRHPFIAGLTDGSLPRERFERYAVQNVTGGANPTLDGDDSRWKP